MDDWSPLPSRNIASEPAPNPQSTMTTTTPPARLTRPPQAPSHGAEQPRPQHTALDPDDLAWQISNQSGASPESPTNQGATRAHRDHPVTPKVKNPEPRLDITRPFMDDTGRPIWVARWPGSGSPPPLQASKLSGRGQKFVQLFE